MCVFIKLHITTQSGPVILVDPPEGGSMILITKTSDRVCVFFPFILDFNGRTSRGHTGRR